MILQFTNLAIEPIRRIDAPSLLASTAALFESTHKHILIAMLHTLPVIWKELRSIFATIDLYQTLASAKEYSSVVSKISVNSRVYLDRKYLRFVPMFPFGPCLTSTLTFYRLQKTTQRPSGRIRRSHQPSQRPRSKKFYATSSLQNALKNIDTSETASGIIGWVTAIPPACLVIRLCSPNSRTRTSCVIAYGNFQRRSCKTRTSSRSVHYSHGRRMLYALLLGTIYA